MTGAEQIATLQKQLDESESKIKDLKEEIAELKDRIEELESPDDGFFSPDNSEDGERALIEWISEQVNLFQRDPLELLREKCREYDLIFTA